MTRNKLADQFFHATVRDENGLRAGVVDDSVAPGFFLVIFFDPLDETLKSIGGDGQAVVPVKNMVGWKFYFTLEAMTAGYTETLKNLAAPAAVPAGTN
jgi:hypothetical protein